MAREGIGFRTFFTVFALGWLLLLFLIWSFCEGLSNHLAHTMYRDLGLNLPPPTEHFSLPMIGGYGLILSPEGKNLYGPTWLTCSVWGILFAWPVGAVVFVWWCRHPDSARWGFLYSSMAYSLFAGAVTIMVALGLVALYLY